MSAQILSGRTVADHLLESLKLKVAELGPKLVVVQVGNDPASGSYIKQKTRSCQKIGMRSEHKHLPEETTIEELFTLIEELNNDLDVSGFFVQLPLPPQLESHVPQIIRAIDPKKDIDGFGAYNIGKMFLSKEYEHLPPATPAGIIEILEYYQIPIEGKHVVVLGRSNTVGKPVAVMLLNRNATVTICHSKTEHLSEITTKADILIAAVGKPKFVTDDMVKEGAVVIDVGIHSTDDGLCGDTDDTVKGRASAITPVPGGVGPMTVACLLRNCVRAKERMVQSDPT